jgi:choline dehydrogenase-like flavoprotein
MFIDGRSVERGSTIQPDLCIIGAGPAEITLALQLLNSDVSVFLLEKGGLNWGRRAQEMADLRVEGTVTLHPKEPESGHPAGQPWRGVAFCCQWTQSILRCDHRCQTMVGRSPTIQSLISTGVR